MYYLNLYRNLIKKELYSNITLENLKFTKCGEKRIEKEINYPFGLNNMRLTIDILMFDWDEKLGILKNNVIDIIKTFLKSNLEIEGIRKKDLCFKIYESDRGVHAFLVSHHLLHFDIDSTTLLQMYLITDYKHIVLTRNVGTDIRLTPKFSEENGNKDFIQKKGIMYKGKFIKYIGNKKNIIPELDNLTKIIYKTQQFILSQPNLTQKTVEEKEFHNLIKKHIMNIYDLKYRNI